MFEKMPIGLRHFISSVERDKLIMRLNIAYSTDELYVRHLGVSMISLFNNNREFREIFVYIIENNISNSSKENLTKIASNYGRNVDFISLDMLSKELTVDNTFPISAYGRLFLGQLIEINKIIYLDCDTIVAGSLYDLWLRDISEFYIAGVQDTVNRYYLTSIHLNNSYRYVNSGFLIANLKKWREDNLEDKFVNFINEFNGSVPHHDQGTINGVCKDKILILEPNYNVQCPMLHFSSTQIKRLDRLKHYYTQEQLNNAKNSPIFIHYTNGFYNRPWNKNCSHPMVNIYLNYLNMSPWKGILLDGQLCRNAKIMKFIYKYMPFFIYEKISNLISYKKSKDLQKKQKQGLKNEK